MQIIEKPDHAEQLQFLTKAVSVWKWAIFPLQPIKRNYKGSLVWCACSKGLKCPTVGKHPKIHWTDRTQYPDLAGIRALLAAGVTGWGVHLGWSGLLCADLDPRAGAEARKFVSEWRYDRGVPLLATHTGSGGIHFYFPDCGKCDPIKGFCFDHGSSSTCIPFGPGDDLFGGQHYCVLPFSPHKSGRIYTIFNPPKEVFWERISEHVPINTGNVELDRSRWRAQEDEA